MTLKEIYKIIDNSHFLWMKVENERRLFALNSQEERETQKEFVELNFKTGHTYFFYKLNEETGEMTLLAKVDHIDKEKKIVKKKLDEMTEEEIDDLHYKNCKKYRCKICPYCLTENKYEDENCIADFVEFKTKYNAFKDREFEVEVEE